MANLKLARESRAAVLETDLSQSVEVLSPAPGRMRDTRSKSVVSISPPTAADQVGIIEDQTVQRPVDTIFYWS